MSETSLKQGVLTLDGQSFTSSELQNLKTTSDVRVVGIQANHTYTIPSSYRNYTFTVFQNGSVTSVQPDSNYQITPSVNSVLVMTKGLDVGNYGNKSGIYSGIVGSTNFSLNYPSENNYKGIVGTTSFTLNYPSDENYSGIVSINSFNINYPADESYSGIVSSSSFSINYPVAVDKTYSGIISNTNFNINYYNTTNYTGIVPSTSFTIIEQGN